MDLKKIFCVFILIATAACKKDKKEPEIEDPFPPAATTKRITRELSTSFDKSGNIQEMVEVVYKFNSVGQLTATQEWYKYPELGISDSSSSELSYNNGKVSQVVVNDNSGSMQINFFYDSQNKLILETTVDAGEIDSTTYQYSGNLISSINRSFGSVTEHFYTIDRDSTHYRWGPTQSVQVEKFYYNSKIDKAYEPLRKILPFYFPHNELIRKVEINEEKLYTREYDNEGYPVKRTEDAPNSKKVTEYFY